MEAQGPPLVLVQAAGSRAAWSSSSQDSPDETSLGGQPAAIRTPYKTGSNPAETPGTPNGNNQKNPDHFCTAELDHGTLPIRFGGVPPSLSRVSTNQREGCSMSEPIVLAEASPEELKEIQRSALLVLTHSLGLADEAGEGEYTEEIVEIKVIIKIFNPNPFPDRVPEL
jgi:hypothetical protein